jgi:hypothetical protein
MSPPKLKGFIPIGAPLSWIPTDGKEPNMRFMPGFDLQWYHKRLGIDFSADWHMDATVRYDAVVKMKSYVNKVFPAIAEFELFYNKDIEESCATISGVHGAMVIYKIYGGEVIYRTDGWPDATGTSLLTLDDVRALEKFDLESNPVVRNLFSQIDVLKQKYGIAHGYLNYQGVINTAFRLRGTEIFADMIDEPELTDRLFHHIAQTTRDFALMIQKRQRETGFDVDLFGSSNCVLNMISPQMYENMLLKYDQFLSRPFRYYAMHTCNWDVSRYIDVLKKNTKIGYIDFGADSDYEKLMEAFPFARKNVLMSPVIMHQPRQERCRIIDKIADELLPCDISLGSTDISVPDEEITWMHDSY